MRATGAGVAGFHAHEGSAAPGRRLSDKPATRAWRGLAACGLLAAAAAAAQPADPLKSPACGQALEQLQAARGAGAAPGQVETLRAGAASTCLGSAAPPQRAGRMAQPPLTVPPPQVTLPRQDAPARAPVPPPPPLAIDRPATPLLCDAGGCWSDTGTHLRQVVPTLPGLPGGCMQQGGALLCP